MSFSDIFSMKIWNTIGLLTVLVELSVSQNISYKELQILKVDCHPYDTCNNTEVNNVVQFKTCQCDEFCADFGDCCVNAKKYSQTNKSLTHKNICWKLSDFEGYYVVATCKRGWVDGDIKRKCEGRGFIEDPLTYLPAMNTYARKTYKNFYCAVCNNDDDSLEYWKMGVLCPQSNSSIASKVQHDLTYSVRYKAWGVYYANQFYQCNLIPTPNDKRNLRFCFPNVKKSCASDWNDETTKEKCKSYTAILHISQTNIRYRNVHCAICNRVRLDHLECGIFSLKETHRTRHSPLSFTSLFDMSEIPSPKCGKDRVYDPVLDKCHVLTCGLPMLKAENGICVPKNKST